VCCADPVELCLELSGGGYAGGHLGVFDPGLAFFPSQTLLPFPTKLSLFHFLSLFSFLASECSEHLPSSTQNFLLQASIALVFLALSLLSL